jgi:putative polyhydroxyalkanoate system protein
VHEIHISRDHGLGLAQARKLAFRWAEAAEENLGMQCTYEEGNAQDVLTFTRAGANGELRVTKDGFELLARLGFLLGAFRERIESEIVKNLDSLLAHQEPLTAFDQAIARRAAQKDKPAPAARKAAKKKA